MHIPRLRNIPRNIRPWLEVRRDKILRAWARRLSAVLLRFFREPVCADTLTTIRKLAAERASFSRFGDAEIMLVGKLSIWYQHRTRPLVKRMRQILRGGVPGLEVGLPIRFCPAEYARLLPAPKAHWEGERRRFGGWWICFTRKGFPYLNASATRPYIDIQDAAYAAEVFAAWRTVWEGRDIVFVEGEASKLGVGNDLFENTKSIHRILAPADHAYRVHDRLLSVCLAQPKDTLFLLALGPTATVLAADLHACGRQAIDVGHIDIEYELYRMGAAEKLPIPGKRFNEARDSAAEGMRSPAQTQYEREIICRVE
ncbi:MAG: GT-D fold domain-containing protein [Oscillospiraceae bacterium]|jgi:glycosyltransferase family protein|nr:GT-D fold domain-containing protein [Oscillospiraceae bacterium]